MILSKINGSNGPWALDQARQIIMRAFSSSSSSSGGHRLLNTITTVSISAIGLFVCFYHFKGLARQIATLINNKREQTQQTISSSSPHPLIDGVKFLFLIFRSSSSGCRCYCLFFFFFIFSIVFGMELNK